MVVHLGGTPSSPWGILLAGPLCGLTFFLGWVAFRKHPFAY
jgi:hypothetical protein